MNKSTGHEFDGGFGERTYDAFIIPAHVNGDLTDRKAGWKGRGVLVHHGLEAKAAAEIGRRADPVVAHFEIWIGCVANVEIGAAPDAVFFGLERFLDQAARNPNRWAIKPRDHLHTIGSVYRGADR